MGVDLVKVAEDLARALVQYREATTHLYGCAIAGACTCGARALIGTAYAQASTALAQAKSIGIRGVIST